ncbi:MAG: hypothetical protein AAF903_02855 [Pseudomonadota bacterium]
MSAFSTGARAHAFESGLDYYEQFLEGASVITLYPQALLPLMAMGLMAALWDKDGMARCWPAFAGGLFIGLPLSALVGPWVIPALMVLGLVIATLAALLTTHNAVLCMAFAFFIGLFAMLSSLEGHGLFELPVFIYVGIVFMANLAFMGTANLSRLALDSFQAKAVPIAVRVAASWNATVLILFLAFQLRNG